MMQGNQRKSFRESNLRLKEQARRLPKYRTQPTRNASRIPELSGNRLFYGSRVEYTSENIARDVDSTLDGCNKRCNALQTGLGSLFQYRRVHAMALICVCVVEASIDRDPQNYGRYFANERADACHVIVGFDADNPKNHPVQMSLWIQEFYTLVGDYSRQHKGKLAGSVYLVGDADAHPRLLVDDPLKPSIDAGAVFRPKTAEFYSDGNDMATSLRNDLVAHEAIPADVFFEANPTCDKPLPPVQVMDERSWSQSGPYYRPQFVLPKSAMRQLFGQAEGPETQEGFPPNARFPVLSIGDQIKVTLRAPGGHVRVLAGSVVHRSGSGENEELVLRLGGKGFADRFRFRASEIIDVAVMRLGVVRRAEEKAEDMLWRQ